MFALGFLAMNGAGTIIVTEWTYRKQTFDSPGLRLGMSSAIGSHCIRDLILWGCRQGSVGHVHCLGDGRMLSTTYIVSRERNCYISRPH